MEETNSKRYDNNEWRRMTRWISFSKDWDAITGPVCKIYRIQIETNLIPHKDIHNVTWYKVTEQLKYIIMLRPQKTNPKVRGIEVKRRVIVCI